MGSNPFEVKPLLLKLNKLLIYVYNIVIQESLSASIILTHPEGLLVAENGVKLLRALEGKVGAIVIDECHKIDDWGREFRKSFSELVVLKSFFNNVPIACLSGTLTGKHINALSKQLLISNFKVISVSPEKTNLKLIVCEKIKGTSYEKIENIYKSQIDQLLVERNNFPVTLMFMPMEYIAHAMSYAYYAFGGVSKITVNNAVFGCLYSNQDTEVLTCIITDLQTVQPRFRLVFTTTVVGMGFDPPSVTQVIHCKPPRSLTNYLQEIGRAGRRGQMSTATLYYTNMDLKKPTRNSRRHFMLL
ncbi:Hypothetical predicted protein [Mytilus galloprovincialis]|uniref:DNA 3'-5' helicase n=1 Tax=Mytilus galloprovincialis TaxID=29158 RepID=A0A8B6GEY9_MYTGA|nr:Hypothetical predicted protein [Mytilus galloprovincialis]